MNMFAQHRTLPELEAGLDALPRAPASSGRVRLLVARGRNGARSEPARATLTVEGGLEGDRWSLKPSRILENQVTVMRYDVARLIAAGEPLSLFGDNVLVDLDLSAESLPAGTRLRVGSALVEVTPEPHTGCAKFAERFGRDALRLVSHKQWGGLNLRGIHWRVIEDGEVAVGDVIDVIGP
jgi:MOSC domain-containing protein YiiM